MSYPFDATLVPNVLNDATFQRTGLYIGSFNGLFYCVVDSAEVKYAEVK